MQSVPDLTVSGYAKEEEAILALWHEISAFDTSLKLSKGKPRYTFYDGPPFATGLPHYGHILAGTIKDVVTRYWSQRGYHVERRFGWDTHGLPVEYEIDKTLNIKGPEDVMKMGIANYNAECRKIVTRYSGEWRTVVNRLGRWIDFENDYKTMYPWFMESVWWVFKQLFDKGLVYQGSKVMPFSTACSTPLSNFESGQNYKEVVDPAVIVSFPLDDDPSTSLLAWTTTPWTLPSNLALCVNPELVYVKVEDKATGKKFILMEARLCSLYKSSDPKEFKTEECTVLDRFPGRKLLGKTYLPLFPYFQHLKTRGAFRVLNDSYVTEQSGTGVVHQAPYFGEDDYRVCLAAGVITKDQEVICPVDDGGRFVDPVTDFAGVHVKEADKSIIKMLKQVGRLVNESSVKHSYPFCWRSETPLIYRAVPSWFIRVEHMSQSLLANNKTCHWVPESVKEKRFANWLADARDWAVSRNRYWGTPIPIWMSEDGLEVVCVGSISELATLSGVAELTDLHREFVDDVVIPSRRPGVKPLRRVKEVFDCWFESGAMPYAQVHYPFENKKQFEDNFPADFIAEGIDQTRGWFYTLLVLSTALFGKPPFKNVIVNGLVLAADGQKMSKSKKNYPDPMEVVNEFGADALRLYLINSPVVNAENLKFKKEGVLDILKDVLLPWYNAYRFFVQNYQRVQHEGIDFHQAAPAASNVMDRWIVSFTQTLVQYVHQEMGAYKLYTVVPRLVKFIDNLTNWYVRMNRKRLKGAGVDAGDCHAALRTLYTVLETMVRMMAPLTPFITELMYQNLRHLTPHSAHTEANASVHFLAAPEAKPELMDSAIEGAVKLMQDVITLGRVIRDRKTLPIKYPLHEVVIIHRDQDSLDSLKTMERYLLEELNVKKVTLTTDKTKYGVTARAEPEHKTLGSRLRNDFKAVSAAIKSLSELDIEKYMVGERLDVLGHTMEDGDLRVFYDFSGDKAADLSLQYEAHSDREVPGLVVLMDIRPDADMLDEGNAREIINRVQKLRKKAQLVPSDPVSVHFQVTPDHDPIATVARKYSEFIETALGMPWRPLLESTPSAAGSLVIEEAQPLKGAELKLVIYKTAASGADPGVPYVNLRLAGIASGNGVVGDEGVVLLQNPAGGSFLSLDGLVAEAAKVFGLQGRPIGLLEGSGAPVTDVERVASGTVFVVPASGGAVTPPAVASGRPPFCRFVNVCHADKKAVVLLENPAGAPAWNHVREVADFADRLLDVPAGSRLDAAEEAVLAMHGRTLHFV